MPTEGLSDATTLLVRRAQSGDDQAKEQLFERYLPRVRRIVGLRLNVTTRSLLNEDDLVQESLLDAVRNLDKFEKQSEGRFCNWMARIVENRLKMTIRRDKAAKRDVDKVRRLSDLDGSSSSGPDLPAKDPTPTAQARGNELDEILEQKLLAMSDRHREVMILRTFCQMSFEEVADEMGLGSGASARALFSKARNELGQALE